MRVRRGSRGARAIAGLAIVAAMATFAVVSPAPAGAQASPCALEGPGVCTETGKYVKTLIFDGPACKMTVRLHWGDGTVDTFDITTEGTGGEQVSYTHQYRSRGIYTVTSSGGGLPVGGSHLCLISPHKTVVEYGTRLGENMACNGRVPTIIGTSGDDTIQGTPRDDVISGLAGNDTIFGRGGDDIICGGSGGDTIFGGTDNDELFGGGGDDHLNGQSGRDLLVGGPGADQLFGKSGRDTLRGRGGPDVLFGGRGRDTCRGGRGLDTIAGC